MKLRLLRPFTYQKTPSQTETIEKGIHDLSAELAAKVLRFGKAERITEKKAPQNKIVEPAENKARVAKKAVRGRSAGANTKP